MLIQGRRSRADHRLKGALLGLVLAMLSLTGCESTIETVAGRAVGGACARCRVFVRTEIAVHHG